MFLFPLSYTTPNPLYSPSGHHRSPSPGPARARLVTAPRERLH